MVMEVCKKELYSLLDARQELEEKIKMLKDILTANNLGMHEELVDKEGFPRNDINIYEVRHARVQLIRAQNDYKVLMKQCEDMLLKYHSQDLPEFKDNDVKSTISVPSHRKIAVVGKVDAGSPSEYAGLKEGDMLLEFGKVNGNNFKGIDDISEEVRRSVNMYIKVVVNRNGTLKRLNLKPKPWSGRGYLGCILNP